MIGSPGSRDDGTLTGVLALALGLFSLANDTFDATLFTLIAWPIRIAVVVFAVLSLVRRRNLLAVFGLVFLTLGLLCQRFYLDMFGIERHMNADPNWMPYSRPH